MVGGRTKVIHRCKARFVKNRYMLEPSGGNMCGYRFVFWASRSAELSGGPGYCGGGARFRRCGCEGGRNLSGFSRTRGFDEEAVEDACRRGGES